MWTVLRKMLARSKTLNAALGEVVYKTPEVSGQNSWSLLQWQVKRGLEDHSFFVGLRMKADASIGPQGSPTNYMNFDIESAQLIRDHLDMCITQYQRLKGEDRVGRSAVS